MKPVAILRNDRHVPPGHLVDVLDEHDMPWTLFPLDEGARPADVSEVRAVVVLGGSMGSYDEPAFPHLTEEKAYLRRVVHSGVPVLGICLGCQLLADVLGGRAYRADRPEARFARLEVAADPVVEVLGRHPVLSIHRDTWDLPPGASLVASSPRYPQAFRLGAALGVQPHPEADHEIVSDWLSTEDGAALARLAGATPQELTAALAESAEGVKETARAFFGRWIDEVLAGERPAGATV